MARHIPDLGELLKEYRKKKKMSQKVLGELINLSDRTLSNIETGYRPPPRYDILLRIGLYLGITERELMWSAAKYYLEKYSASPTTEKETENKDE